MRHLSLALALPCLLAPLSLLADEFSSHPYADHSYQFSMEFVDIPGGTDDDHSRASVSDYTGYGAVGYDYRIGKYEVRRSMIDTYNAVRGNPTITMYDFDSAAGITANNAPDRPATGISWNEAARFVNWLNTSQGYSAAYNFTTGGANDNITLWTAGDDGYDASNPFRNSNAHYFLPTEDEWYRAAYYNPNAYNPNANGGRGGFENGASSSGLVYNDVTSGPRLVTDAGGPSPYGTVGQGGNAEEWTESTATRSNGSATEDRVRRGGSWTSATATDLSSSARELDSPTSQDWNVGFRIASVPEPSGLMLTLLGGMGLVMRRKRS